VSDLVRTMDESKSKVLIVDDSVDMHQLLRARLKHDELEFESAFSEDDAFQRAIVWNPELILLDIAMPTDEGLHLLKRLKDEPRTRDIPVIVVSAHQSPRFKVAAFDLGVVDYITKPFELIELRVRLRSALRMYQLLQMLAQRAQIDGLTGLWNRSYFDKRWLEEYSRCTRHGHALSVAFMDLDHFKSVNDNYGHPIGDMVLQGVARVIQREGRTSDLACRFGGEEFVLVMPDTSAIEAAVVCERVRQAVAEARWPRVSDLRTTISIGVCGAPGGVAVTHEEWVELADKNLYAAKRSGRNRVVVSDLSTTPNLTLRQAS
jgi:two-component system, cell cycle response regulator